MANIDAKFMNAWNAPRINSFEANTDLYSNLRRPELTPFHVPGFNRLNGLNGSNGGGFLDSHSQVLMPLNEQSGSILNSHGTVNPTVTLEGYSRYFTTTTNKRKAAHLDSGVSSQASRPPSGTALTSELLFKTTYAAGQRIAAFKLDHVPLHRNQTCNLSNTRISFDGINTVFGAAASTLYAVKQVNATFPTTVAELDALTLTTASLIFGSGTNTTLTPKDLIDEVTALSGWQFGDSIIFVVVNNVTPGGETKADIYRYAYVTPITPKPHRPLMPNGNGFNIGGYAPSLTMIDSGGDVTDYYNIYYSGAYSFGEDVSLFLNTQGSLYYVQYLNTNFTTNWLFEAPFNDSNIPDFIQVVLELDAGQTGIYFKNLTIVDHADNVIGKLSGPCYTSGLDSGKQFFTFDVPISRRAINTAELAHFHVIFEDLKGATSKTSHTTTVKIYSVALKPIYGQFGRLIISNVDLSSDYTICFWLYKPQMGSNDFLLDTTDRATSGFLNNQFYVTDNDLVVHGTEIALSTFDHYAITKASDVISVYKNGKLILQPGFDFIANTEFSIGGFSGAINDLRFYDQAIDQKEIFAISNRPYLPRMVVYPDPDKVETVKTPIFADPLILLLGLL